MSENDNVEVEDYKINFNENEDLNSQTNEDFVNEKRFKSSVSDFKVVGSPPDSFKLVIHSDPKKIQEENDQTLEFASFKNYNDFYPEDMKEDFMEEEAFNFKIDGFHEKNKKIIQQLSHMENKVRGDINNKGKTYYQSYSFRVSWCKDGFTSIGTNKCGAHQININKLIVYQEFFQNTRNSETDYENYTNIVKNYNKNISTLFTALVDKYDLESVEKNIENMSFVENNENERDINKYSWPQKQQFIQRIFLYMYKYSKVLNLQKDHLFKEKFYDDEIFNLSLINVLFGNSKIDFMRFFKLMRTNLIDEKYFNILYENIDKYQQNTLTEDYQRKILLNKLLEAKSAKVLFKFNFL